MSSTTDYRTAFIHGTIGLNFVTFLQWQIPSSAAPVAANFYGPMAQKFGVSIGICENFTLSLYNMRRGRWWTLLTSTFSHQEISHLAGNMLNFYTNAKTGFDLGLGPWHMTALSVGSALAGSLAALWHMSDTRCVMGASGMVYGLIAGVTLCAPNRLVVLAKDVVVPQWSMAAMCVAWEAYDLLREIGGRQIGTREISHAAHIGGAVFGAAYWCLFLRPHMRARTSAEGGYGGWDSRRGAFGGTGRRL